MLLLTSVAILVLFSLLQTTISSNKIEEESSFKSNSTFSPVASQVDHQRMLHLMHLLLSANGTMRNQQNINDKWNVERQSDARVNERSSKHSSLDPLIELPQTYYPYSYSYYPHYPYSYSYYPRGYYGYGYGRKYPLVYPYSSPYLRGRGYYANRFFRARRKGLPFYPLGSGYGGGLFNLLDLTSGLLGGGGRRFGLGRGFLGGRGFRRYDYDYY